MLEIYSASLLPGALLDPTNHRAVLVSPTAAVRLGLLPGQPSNLFLSVDLAPCCGGLAGASPSEAWLVRALPASRPPSPGGAPGPTEPELLLPPGLAASWQAGPEPMCASHGGSSGTSPLHEAPKMHVRIMSRHALPAGRDEHPPAPAHVPPAAGVYISRVLTPTEETHYSQLDLPAGGWRGVLNAEGPACVPALKDARAVLGGACPDCSPTGRPVAGACARCLQTFALLESTCRAGPPEVAALRHFFSRPRLLRPGEVLTVPLDIANARPEAVGLFRVEEILPAPEMQAPAQGPERLFVPGRSFLRQRPPVPLAGPAPVCPESGQSAWLRAFAAESGRLAAHLRAGTRDSSGLGLLCLYSRLPCAASVVEEIQVLLCAAVCRRAGWFPILLDSAALLEPAGPGAPPPSAAATRQHDAALAALEDRVARAVSAGARACVVAFRATGSAVAAGPAPGHSGKLSEKACDRLARIIRAAGGTGIICVKSKTDLSEYLLPLVTSFCVLERPDTDARGAMLRRSLSRLPHDPALLCPGAHGQDPVTEAAELLSGVLIASAPCVLFFDELDALAPARSAGSTSSSSGGVLGRVVSQLLAELDAVSTSSAQVYCIAATNRPELCDQDLFRPGRFDRMLYLGPAESASAQVNILRACFRSMNAGRYPIDPAVRDCDQTLMAALRGDTGAGRASSLAENGGLGQANAPDPGAEEGKAPAPLTGADIRGLCEAAFTLATRRCVARLQELSPGSAAFRAERVLVQAADLHHARAALVPSVSPEQLAEYNALRDRYT
ncbi:hypothetical protein H696_02834 [Fonticula alba]|uniref:ATPase AAA-type core domain-containing protein n=1 Tax=Fonticula alba TaxID=691883 RepID=A0A058Z9C5_FONAL|nr:hypothetical protein H696_02834 [Fonticula alba]KCV70493.1 hypothetical protein H696_02834 [Fonticula alba]|eukprot:XP_009495009.1 hypothetical protein H696_02834 [Fonticula alba]